MEKRLYRSKNRMIGGVCSGIAEYFNIDPVIVRAIFLGMLFLGGGGLILYLILLIIVPEKPHYDHYVEVNENGENVYVEENDVNSKTNTSAKENSESQKNKK